MKHELRGSVGEVRQISLTWQTKRI